MYWNGNNSADFRRHGKINMDEGKQRYEELQGQKNKQEGCLGDGI